MERIRCYLLKSTGRMTPYVDGISSPIYTRDDEPDALYHTGFEDRYKQFGIKQAGPGAMYFIEGSGLCVICPGGHWHPDAGKWTRTGEPPDCTIRPSILFFETNDKGERVNGYHAFLTNGWLEEC